MLFPMLLQYYIFICEELLYNGIMLTYKKNKKQNPANCCCVDRTRSCHTEWSESKGEGRIANDSSLMWNIEKHTKVINNGQ